MCCNLSQERKLSPDSAIRFVIKSMQPIACRDRNLKGLEMAIKELTLPMCWSRRLPRDTWASFHVHSKNSHDSRSKLNEKGGKRSLFNICQCRHPARAAALTVPKALYIAAESYCTRQLKEQQEKARGWSQPHPLCSTAQPHGTRPLHDSSSKQLSTLPTSMLSKRPDVPHPTHRFLFVSTWALMDSQVPILGRASFPGRCSAGKISNRHRRQVRIRQCMA